MSILNESIPIVIDNGSGYIKAGFSGNDVPSLTFPTMVGRPKHQKIMAGALEGNIFVGKKADAYRGLLELKYPISNGIIENWADLELIWSHIYSELKCSSEQHPVLIAHSPMISYAAKQKIAEIFFEQFNCPALHISAQAVLALYSTGRTTGFVVDCGDGITYTLPVFEGFALSNTLMQSCVAGNKVTNEFALQLKRSGYIFNTSAEMQIVQSIKETTGFVLLKAQSETNNIERSYNTSYVSYQLPDGTSMKIGPERFLSPEILFNPKLICSESLGIQNLLHNAIQKTDLDLRRNLYSQIILVGGSTYFPGFGDRLLYEIQKMTSRTNKIRIFAPSDRKFLTWIGGSILSSLSVFKKLCISKQDYENERICFDNTNLFF